MTAPASEPLVNYWVAERPIPGQNESGDQFLVAHYPGGVLVAVVDGLGHGDLASLAAKQAVATLAAQPDDPVQVLMQRCHEALRKTRGAVVTLASFEASSESMTWLAVGNVEAVLRRSSKPRGKSIAILPRGGIVGDRLPPLNPATLAVFPGDLLLLATDGIASNFLREVDRMEQPRQLINHIFAQHAKNTDDALILGVQWTNGSRASTCGAP
ncbi:SpoIIE family protein phosphatase [Noviherbaspirillum sp. ST9]|uniref:SpoIIE family protein phosphatase n=1 Tax=Noviherbaspirillum sp. ST9 TaxID=3401606 RepID=UPI003B58A769